MLLTVFKVKLAIHVYDLMRNKTYHTVIIFPKSNIKIIDRDKINTPNSKITHFPGLVYTLQ